MPFGLPDSQQKLTYGGYLRVRELTALQELKSDPAQHDDPWLQVAVVLSLLAHSSDWIWGTRRRSR